MNRFKEPSTWAGIAALAQVAASFLPTNWAWVAHALTAAAGSAAVSLRELPK
jgi:hypothetical protein